MRTSFVITTVVALAAVVLRPVTVFSQDCACGPDFCQNDPRYAPRLAQAKSKMQSNGYPQDLIALMDKDGACFARIDQAPVNFHIRPFANGVFQDVEWDADNERIARKQLTDGTISGYYKFNVPRAFKCCGEKQYNERPDYDAVHDVNRTIVVECKLVNGNIACQ
jgi:hypothetical protein